MNFRGEIYRSLEMASFEPTRDPNHERVRMITVIFESEECQKPSKNLRTALQWVVLLNAGEEVTLAGDLHPGPRYNLLAVKVDAHKTKLINDLEALVLLAGKTMPQFFRDAILFSNNNGKKWIVSPNEASWKKMKRVQTFMRNHCLPLWKSISKGKALPSGVALDELILNHFKVVGMIKEKGEILSITYSFS